MNKPYIKWTPEQIDAVLDQAQALRATNPDIAKKDLWIAAQDILKKKDHRKIYPNMIYGMERLLAARTNPKKVKRKYTKRVIKKAAIKPSGTMADLKAQTERFRLLKPLLDEATKLRDYSRMIEDAKLSKCATFVLMALVDAI